MNLPDYILESIHIDTEKVNQIYSFCHAIDFFGNDERVQLEIVDSGCPILFAWYEMFDVVKKFERHLNNRNFGAYYDAGLHEELNKLIECFYSLSEKETQEGSREIFSFDGWDKIRVQSRVILTMIEWEVIKLWEGDFC